MSDKPLAKVFDLAKYRQLRAAQTTFGRLWALGGLLLRRPDPEVQRARAELERDGIDVDAEVREALAVCEAAKARARAGEPQTLGERFGTDPGQCVCATGGKCLRCWLARLR